MTGRGPETRTIAELLETMDAGPAPEPAGAARAWLDAHRGGLGAFIDGAFAALDGAAPDGAAPGDDAVAASDPATGDILAAVARGSGGSVEAAVAAAARAAPSWAATPGGVRGRHLRAVARALEARGRALAVLDALNTGRPVRAARDRDLPRAIRCFLHHAGSAELCADDFPGRAPQGVRAVVLPPHATLASLARDVAPALAAGNALVIAPTESAPLVALFFAELCRDAGLPPGVLNAVPGGAAAGAALARHPGVAGIAFAGAREQARAVAAAAAGSNKALDLTPEGGPQRVLVFADADLDAAVEGVVDAAWSGGGASGTAGARILAQEGVAARFAAKLRRRLDSLRIGDPLDSATDVGTTAEAARLRRLVAAAEAEGAEPVRAGAPLPSNVPMSGSFFPPTLLLGVEPASALAGTDFSGPLATLSTFRTPAEAIALAGGGDAQASVWSQDVDLALDVALRVRAGAIFVNAAGPGDAAEDADGDALERQLAPAASVRAAAPRPARRPGPDLRTPPALRVDVGPTVATAVGEAVGAGAWSSASPRERARVLAAAAEALAARAPDLVGGLSSALGAAEAEREVEAALRRMSSYAARAGGLGRLGGYAGSAGSAGARRLLLRVDEPRGVLGLVCPDEAPLLALVSLALPALAAGNRAVAVVSTLCPSVAAELLRALGAGGLPSGALSIAAGERGALACALAEHEGVDAVWHHGPSAEAAAVERAAAGDLRPVWADDGPSRDWFDDATAQGAGFLRRAVRVRTVWLPYGE